MQHTFILDGLDCANCAGRIEQKIADVPGYSDVSLTFVTRELRLNCDKRNIKEDIQSIVDSVESGVTVRDQNEKIVEEEESEEHSPLRLILLGVAIALFIAAFVTHFFDRLTVVSAVMAVVSVVLSGYDVVIDGVKAVMKRRLDETTLMTVAVIAAMVLGEFVEAAAVTVLFALGEMIEDRAVERSRRDIRRLADIRPDRAYVYEDGRTVEYRAEDVPVGAILSVPPHTRVPLDGVVTEGSSSLDASSLTGESIPLPAHVGTELLSGMMNNDAMLRMRVTRPYADSAATRIVRLVEENARNKGNSEKLITRFARVYTPVMIVLAVLVALIPSLITGDYATWIHRALVCLVASCPCSIVISVPLSYYAGIGAASRHGVLIKGGRYLEAVAKSLCFAFDKTGTLTENKISVKEIKPVNNYSEKEILQLAASAEQMSTHPIASAIRERAAEEHISILELSDYHEKSGFGVTARDGDRLISCSKRADDSGVEVTADGEVIGIIILQENIRNEASAVLSALRALGIGRLTMLTGDKKSSADRIADALALDGCYSELLPEQKVEKIESLIEDEGLCCYVGDGINDAPVLTRSSCGIAMGLASDAAIESADMVLSSGTLSALPTAVRISRETMRTVRANIIFSLAVKALVILLAMLGAAPIWLAVFADTGVCVLCILYATRLIRKDFL